MKFSRSNSLKIFPMKLYQVQIPSESTDLQMENVSLSRGLIGSVCNLQKYSIAWVLI